MFCNSATRLFFSLSLTCFLVCVFYITLRAAHLVAADKSYLSSPLKGVSVHLRHPFRPLIKPYVTCLIRLPSHHGLSVLHLVPHSLLSPKMFWPYSLYFPWGSLFSPARLTWSMKLGVVDCLHSFGTYVTGVCASHSWSFIRLRNTLITMYM